MECVHVDLHGLGIEQRSVDVLGPQQRKQCVGLRG